MSFRDWLLRKQREEEEANRPRPEDEMSHLIGHKAGPEDERSVFDAFLGAVTAGSDVPVVEKTPREHDWQACNSLKYSCESPEWKCTKCGVSVTLEGDKPLEDSLEEAGINSDCSEELMARINQV